jgi:MFS family permease
MPADAGPKGAKVKTDIPARLDRLPWGRFHWLFVCALGVTWVLDGLEVTVVGAVGNALLEPDTLGLRPHQLALAQSGYLVGAITGAMFFGHLTDRLGRKKLFTVTLLVYLAGTVFTALSWGFWSFAAARLVTGLAIGGEYAAINSAIDELIPARLRGRVDLAVNGTFWLGALIGSAMSVVLLDRDVVPHWLGWRLAFGAGAAVAFGMIIARRFVPESPRWLVTHGRKGEADEIVDRIEKEAEEESGPLPEPGPPIEIVPGRRISFGRIARTMTREYRSRAVLGLVLIASQAFFYNGLSFTYPLVLKQTFGVPDDRVGWYVAATAVANLLGPLLLGGLFDTVGRRRMISGTYAVSAALLAAAAGLIWWGELTPVTLTGLWMATFFFASAAASAGYLTVSEVFPLEMRAMAIALFYAVGTAVGGALAPTLFGYLLETGAAALVLGYLLGAGLMAAASATEWFLGVDAEGRGLEEIATPLSAAGAGGRP